MKLKMVLLCMTLILLGILGFPSYADDRVLNSFIHTLEGNDSHARMEAAISLGDLGDPRAVEPLIKALNDSNKYVRFEAARSLGNIGDRRAVDPLIMALKENSADETTMQALIQSLAWFADPKSIDALSQVINDINKKRINERDRIDYVINNLAVWGVARTKDSRAIEPLIRALNDDSLAHDSAIAGLVAIGKPAIDPLIRTLNDNKFEARYMAALVLGEIGDPSAVEPLIRILNNASEHSSLRRNSALALGAIGDSHAIDPLIQASKDPDADIRDAASDALVMINNHVKPEPTRMPDVIDFY